MTVANTCYGCAGGQELRRAESHLKASARPYVPLSSAVQQLSPAQQRQTSSGNSQVGLCWKTCAAADQMVQVMHALLCYHLGAVAHLETSLALIVALSTVMNLTQF